MTPDFRQKAIAICSDKIAKKGEGVGLSFYAFFKNRNDDPELLMQVASWWIKTHQLDHFEKAVKIRGMLQAGT
ncbi:DUF6500 family protein [Pseudophaeobacter sp.]|uniref:DUF6500 family protein n=1 Tax=Pseudophaeobacter sp. TaxID=1971739 RepID=UPI003297184D